MMVSQLIAVALLTGVQTPSLDELRTYAEIIEPARMCTAVGYQWVDEGAWEERQLVMLEAAFAAHGDEAASEAMAAVDFGVTAQLYAGVIAPTSREAARRGAMSLAYELEGRCRALAESDIGAGHLLPPEPEEGRQAREAFAEDLSSAHWEQ